MATPLSSPPGARVAAAVAIAVAGLLVGAAAASEAAPARGATAMIAPVTPMRAADLFDPPPRPWLPGHRGIDLLTTVGATVYAPAPGTVTFVGRVVDRDVVTISHGALRSSLEPVTATVAKGAVVPAGTAVGTVGRDPGHCAPRTCVHWGVRAGDTYVDPLDLLAGFGPVVLLPG